MAEEPLVIGAVLLIMGIVTNMLNSVISEGFGVSIQGWGWLLILVGLAVFFVRLNTMSKR